jgi:hypothetical protein
LTVPDELRDAKRTASVARRRLDPEALERSLPQEAAIADAVERHAPGQAQVLEPRLRCAVRAMRSITSSHTTCTERARSISFCVSFVSGLRGGPPNEVMECLVRHGQAGEIVEVPLIQRERPVLTEVDQLLKHQVDVRRLTIRREPHDLVLARIDLEAV